MKSSALQTNRSVIYLACLAGIACAPSAVADWNWTNLSNPNWDISLTDAGYSDYLLDHTPGFVGREYLSGEWGAAIGYAKDGATVTPTWLEPMFSFPDWPTNSTFTTQSPMTVNAFDGNGLPTGATSILSNGDLKITQNVSIVDTVVGTPMGLSAASSGGAGSSLMSNRYVLMQTYTFQNTSTEALSNIQLFQLLHGLNSQTGSFDNRAYSGAFSEYRYDVTLRGADPAYSAGQFDYIGFHSSLAPSAVEIGYYGTFAADDHVSSKPSVGTHLSVEGNNLNGQESFSPQDGWIAGAQRWDLGTIAPGDSVSMSVMLTIRTGWEISAGVDGGSSNGGASNPGGLDYLFLGDHSDGLLFVDYAIEDPDGISEMVALGEFGPLTFQLPGTHLQLFDVEFEGSFDEIQLTFAYDAGLLSPGFDESQLHLFHWTGSNWEDLHGDVDATNHTITAITSGLSPFAIAAVPEPETWMMYLIGLTGVALRLRAQSRSSSRVS